MAKRRKMDKDFRTYLMSAVERKCYVKIQYFTDIHEFLTRMAVMKKMITREGREYVCLASGEEIFLGQIVRVNDEVAPNYRHVMDFTCDC